MMTVHTLREDGREQDFSRTLTGPIRLYTHHSPPAADFWRISGAVIAALNIRLAYFSVVYRVYRLCRLALLCCNPFLTSNLGNTQDGSCTVVGCLYYVGGGDHDRCNLMRTRKSNQPLLWGFRSWLKRRQQRQVVQASTSTTAVNDHLTEQSSRFSHQLRLFL